MTYNILIPVDIFLITECVCIISGKGGPTLWEHLRALVGGQLPQDEGNLLILKIRFGTNPNLVSGWGFTLTPA